MKYHCRNAWISLYIVEIEEANQVIICESTAIPGF